MPEHEPGHELRGLTDADVERLGYYQSQRFLVEDGSGRIERLQRDDDGNWFWVPEDEVEADA